MHPTTLQAGILAQAPQTSDPIEKPSATESPLREVLKPVRQLLLQTPAPTGTLPQLMLDQVLAPLRPALAASLWTLESLFSAMGPSKAQHNMATDITVSELLTMTHTQEPENLLVLFHASWCQPCKIFAKPEYQQAIQEFNRTHSKTRVVTMRIDNEADPLMEDFYQRVGIIVTKGIHKVTGEEVVDESYAVPSSFLLHTPSGKYARSYKIPKTPDQISLIADVGFRKPEAFPRDLPTRATLKKSIRP